MTRSTSTHAHAAPSRVGLHACLIAIISLAIGATIAFLAGMHLVNLAKGETMTRADAYPILVIIAGGAIGIGGVLGAVLRYAYVKAGIHGTPSLWVANTRRPAQAVGLGVLAFLAAAALHSFNDAVLGDLLKSVSTWAGALISYALIALIFVFWFRPQLVRVREAGGN